MEGLEDLKGLEGNMDSQLLDLLNEGLLHMPL